MSNHKQPRGESGRAAILAFFARYEAAHHAPPTLKEIGAACHYSKTGVRFHLDTLAEQGLLVNTDLPTRRYRLPATTIATPAGHELRLATQAALSVEELAELADQVDRAVEIALVGR